MNQLRKVRFLKGLTQLRLQLRSGIHRTHISFFENGLLEPTTEEKKKLAKALRMQVWEIWPENGKKKFTHTVGTTLLTGGGTSKGLISYFKSESEGLDKGKNEKLTRRRVYGV